MFTGIVQGIGKIKEINKKEDIVSFVVASNLTSDLQIGASIAVDGVCLTVTEFSDNSFSFDVVLETLRKTNLGQLDVGSQINLERSAKAGDEIGGHLVSGHVDGTAKVKAINESENNYAVTFEVEPQWMKYIFSKGFIALNGTSLTVVDADKTTNTFDVWFIPETLRKTTFAKKQIDDLINFEIERQTQVIVDTVIDCVQAKLEEQKKIVN